MTTNVKTTQDHEMFKQIKHLWIDFLIVVISSKFSFNLIKFVSTPNSNQWFLKQFNSSQNK